jgi:hypothetical protein
MKSLDGGCMHCRYPNGTRASLGCRCPCHDAETIEQKAETRKQTTELFVRAINDYAMDPRD